MTTRWTSPFPFHGSQIDNSPNYSTTLVDVYNYSQAAGIPYKFVRLSAPAAQTFDPHMNSRPPNIPYPPFSPLYYGSLKGFTRFVVVL